MPKYRVFSGPYFPVFGPEKTRHLETFYAVNTYEIISILGLTQKKLCLLVMIIIMMVMMMMVMMTMNNFCDMVD